MGIFVHILSSRLIMSKSTLLKILAVVLVVVNVASIIYNVISGNRANKKVKSIKERLCRMQTNLGILNMDFDKLETEIGDFGNGKFDKASEEELYDYISQKLTDDDFVDHMLEEED